MTEYKDEFDPKYRITMPEGSGYGYINLINVKSVSAWPEGLMGASAVSARTVIQHYKFGDSVLHWPYQPIVNLILERIKMHPELELMALDMIMPENRSFTFIVPASKITKIEQIGFDFSALPTVEVQTTVNGLTQVKVRNDYWSLCSQLQEYVKARFGKPMQQQRVDVQVITDVHNVIKPEQQKSRLFCLVPVSEKKSYVTGDGHEFTDRALAEKHALVKSLEAFAYSCGIALPEARNLVSKMIEESYEIIDALERVKE